MARHLDRCGRCLPPEQSRLIGWGIWETLLKLWPVLLIGIGLDLWIGRRSVWGSFAVAVLLLGVLGAALWFGVPQGVSTESVRRKENVQQAIGEVTKADVDVDFSFGRLQIDALPEGAALVEGTVDLGERETLDQSYRAQNGTGYYVLKSHNEGIVSWPATELWDSDHVWDLGLSRDIPLALHVSLGAGRSYVDLSRLNVTRLTMDCGVGEVHLTLPRQGSLSAHVDGGVGEIVITIPSGMAARIAVDRGLGGRDVSGDYIQSGDSYVSPDYDTATNRVSLNVNGGIGKVTIIQEEEG